jgi:hypothetical protein
MNCLSKIAFCLVAMTATVPVMADESDTMLDREKTLESMRFKKEQLKIQGDMSESWKKMTDAGVIVDTDGLPLGVKSIQEMAIEVRGQKKGPTESNPFDGGGLGVNQNGIAPNGMPFMTDQQAMMPPQPFQGPQTGPRHPPVAPPSADAEKKPPTEEEKPVLKLLKVEASSVTIRTNDGDHVVRIGEKINGLTLTKFGVDQAFLKGPKGLQTISINWSSR